MIKRAALALLLSAGCDDGEDGGDEGSMGSTGAEASTGDAEPCRECEGAPECHSLFIGGHCWCEHGHQWEDPASQDDFTCVPIPPRMGECTEEFNVLVDGQCHCEGGYIWCSEDPADFTCCEDPSQAEPEED